MRALRVAFFVEGSESPPMPRSADAFQELWARALPAALGIKRPNLVVPISKKHMVAMDAGAPPMSGAGERLDQLMARILHHRPFDAAVVLWDLLPPWSPRQHPCRWDECLALYEGISRSDALGAPWRREAAARLAELRARPQPKKRAAVPRLEPNAVLGVCMEPVFEALVLQDEQVIRRALGVRNRKVPDWPRPWRIGPIDRCDIILLGRALEAARRTRPRPAVFSKLPPSVRTHKNEWNLHLLRLIANEKSSHLVRHPIARRLIELLRAEPEHQGRP